MLDNDAMGQTYSKYSRKSHISDSKHKEDHRFFGIPKQEIRNLVWITPVITKNLISRNRRISLPDMIAMITQKMNPLILDYSDDMTSTP